MDWVDRVESQSPEFGGKKTVSFGPLGQFRTDLLALPGSLHSQGYSWSRVESWHCGEGGGFWEERFCDTLCPPDAAG